MCRIHKVLFWFYRQHTKETIFILKAINTPPAGIIPTRKIVSLPSLLKNKVLASEEKYDECVSHLENAGYIKKESNDCIALLSKEKKLLLKYEEFHVLRPLNIIQTALKKNLTAIMAQAALIISIFH